MTCTSIDEDDDSEGTCGAETDQCHGYWRVVVLVIAEVYDWTIVLTVDLTAQQ